MDIESAHDPRTARSCCGPRQENAAEKGQTEVILECQANMVANGDRKCRTVRGIFFCRAVGWFVIQNFIYSETLGREVTVDRSTDKNLIDILN